MGYMHISNLYKNQDILLFKECFAMEKIHGTSAHVSFKDGELSFFSGGVKHNDFINLFNKEELLNKFASLGIYKITVYGEAYGGKCQGMKDTYGNNLKFVAFEVKIDDSWLSVPQAESVAKDLGFDFVYYTKSTTKLEDLDRIRESPSVQSKKCGIIGPMQQEGIVLRPLIELTKNNGERIISKYKNDDFRETNKNRSVGKDKLEILTKAKEIADEWVTEMRLTHVLDSFQPISIEKTGDIIKAMIEDIEREAEGEIITSKDVRKIISSKTAIMFKNRLKSLLKEGE